MRKVRKKSRLNIWEEVLSLFKELYGHNFTGVIPTKMGSFISALSVIFINTIMSWPFQLKILAQFAKSKSILSTEFLSIYYLFLHNYITITF